MMNLESAIKHCEEVMMENLEKTKDRNASDPIAINCFECADEHRQLAEWLKELKAYREQSGDAISRQAVLDILKDKWNMFSDANDAMQESIDTIEAISSVTPQQRTGRWINSHIPESTLCECSACGFTCGAYSFNYCPNCGAKMEVSGCTKNI